MDAINDDSCDVEGFVRRRRPAHPPLPPSPQQQQQQQQRPQSKLKSKLHHPNNYPIIAKVSLCSSDEEDDSCDHQTSNLNNNTNAASYGNVDTCMPNIQINTECNSQRAFLDDLPLEQLEIKKEMLVSILKEVQKCDDVDQENEFENISEDDMNEATPEGWPSLLQKETVQLKGSLLSPNPNETRRALAPNRMPQSFPAELAHILPNKTTQSSNESMRSQNSNRVQFVQNESVLEVISEDDMNETTRSKVPPQMERSFTPEGWPSFLPNETGQLNASSRSPNLTPSALAPNRTPQSFSPKRAHILPNKSTQSKSQLNKIDRSSIAIKTPSLLANQTPQCPNESMSSQNSNRVQFVQNESVLEDISEDDMNETTRSKLPPQMERSFTPEGWPSFLPNETVQLKRSLHSPNPNETPRALAPKRMPQSFPPERAHILPNKTTESKSQSNRIGRSPIANQTPQCSNESMRSQYSSPLHSVQNESVLEDISEDDMNEMKQSKIPPPIKRSFTPVGRPSFLRNETGQLNASLRSPIPNETPSALAPNRAPQSFPPKRAHILPNETTQSKSQSNKIDRSPIAIKTPPLLANQTPQCSNESMRSQNSNRVQFVQNDSVQAIGSSETIKSSVTNEFQSSFTPNRRKQLLATVEMAGRHVSSGTPKSFTPYRERILSNERVHSSSPNGITKSPIENNAPSSFAPSQKPRPFPSNPNEMPRSFIPTTPQSSTPDRAHFLSNISMQSLVSNDTSKLFTPIQMANRMAPTEGQSQSVTPNVDRLAKRVTPIQDNAPETPESGIAEYDSSDFELDLPSLPYKPAPPPTKTVWSSKAQFSKKEPHKNDCTTSNSTHFNSNILNNKNQQKNECTVSGHNSSVQQPQIDHKQCKEFLDKCTKNIADEVVKAMMSKMPKIQSAMSCDSNSSSDDESCTSEGSASPMDNQSMNKRRANNESASSINKSGNKRQRTQSDSESEEMDTSTEEDDAKDILFELPNDDDDYDDDDADDNYESDSSTFSRDTQPLGHQSGSDDDESSSDSKCTLPNFSDSECTLPDFSVRQSNSIINSASNSQNDDNNDNELLVQLPTIQNTDKSLYLSSEKAKVCPLCKKRYKNMVSHFKLQHNEYEVFVSRISPKMVEYAAQDNDQRKFAKHIKHHSEHVQAVCLFCENEKIFSAHYWTDHMRSHTGEYGNRCVMCQKLCSFSTHCNVATLKEDNFDLRDQDLNAYRCNECNYVQIYENNMRTHLENQHGLYDADGQYYQMFTLLPAFCSLPKQEQSQGLIQANLAQNLQSSSEILFQTQTQTQCNQINVQTEQQPPKTSIPNQPISSTSRKIQILETLIIPSPIQTTPTKANAPRTSNKIPHPMVPLKMDPGAAESLLNVFKDYNEFKELKPFELNVRPYIPEDYAKKLDINPITQFALYKCMQDACLFACNSENVWKIHMKEHINLYDALTDHQLLDDYNRSDFLKFRECSYCGSEPSMNHQVCRHMEMEHRRNAFQCAHCFYRTIEMDNMVLHMEEYHSDLECEILVYDLQREFLQSDIDDLNSGCLQYINKIKCDLDNCSNEFVCIGTLCSHQIFDHDAKMYKCPYCHTYLKLHPKTILEHINRLHSEEHLEQFQCLHCDLGFNTTIDTKKHMSEKHASKFLFIGARRNLNISDDSQEVDVKREDDINIVYVGELKDYSAYKLFTCLNHDALDSMDPTKLSPHDLYKAQQMQNATYANIKVQYSGSILDISFEEAGKCEYYKQYRKAYRSHSKSQKHSDCKGSVLKKNPESDSTSGQVAHDSDRSTIPTTKSTSASLPCSIQPNHSNEPVPSTSIDCSNHITTEATATATASAAAALIKLSIQYICITNQMYDNLSTNLGYQSRLCCICCKIQRIDKENGLQSYLMHLTSQHACKKEVKMTNAEQMFDHQMKHHRKQPLFALQIENSIDPNSKWLVYKIVRGRYKCKLCMKHFDTLHDIDLHNSLEHRNLLEPIDIIFESMVITSTDPQQSIDSVLEFRPLVLFTLFKCGRCQPSCVYSRKSSAIRHHNEHHSKEAFEITLKKFAYDSKQKPMDYYYDDDDDDDDYVDNPALREYLFQCFHCKVYCGSLDSFNSKHNCDEHARFPKFQMHKLVACSYDKIVGTFAHMKRHNMNKHLNKPFTPINIFHPNECGLCAHRFEGTDLTIHYQIDHSKTVTESITNDVLDSIERKGVSVGECYYAPGCCRELKWKGLSQIVNHISICSRRFTCTQCTMQHHTDLNSFVAHCQKFHGRTNSQIFEQLHNLKHFSSLFSDMQIIFPIGLSVTIDNILDTDFETKLRLDLNTKILKIIVRERTWNQID